MDAVRIKERLLRFDGLDSMRQDLGFVVNVPLELHIEYMQP